MKRSILIFLFILGCISPAFAQSASDRELVQKYLFGGQAACFDCPEPYSEELAARPELAPLLADALKSAEPKVVEKRLGIIFMLGRMGNPAAFAALAGLYDRSQPDAARIRLLTSMGACLSEATRDQYIDLAVGDPEVLMWLEETVGKICETDVMCWRIFFQPEELAKFKEQCRRMSQPVLG